MGAPPPIERRFVPTKFGHPYGPLPGPFSGAILRFPDDASLLTPKESLSWTPT